MSQLPVKHGLSLRHLAMKVAEMQDAHVSTGKVRRWAEEFYSRMKVVCQHYTPHADASNAKYLDTMCSAGFNGTMPCGDRCTECQVFDFHFHPKARTTDSIVAPEVWQARMAQIAAEELVQIR